MWWSVLLTSIPMLVFSWRKVITEASRIKFENDLQDEDLVQADGQMNLSSSALQDVHQSPWWNSTDSPKRETFAEEFVRVFRETYQMISANDNPGDKRIYVTGDPGKNQHEKTTVKQWHSVNNQLRSVRDRIIPKEYGDSLIENTLKAKIIEKLEGPGGTAGGNSGTTLLLLPFDDRTGHAYILKGESREMFKAGVLPILDSYARRLEESNPCQESSMMKVLMVFEPLDIRGGGSVNNKVWMLITNISPVSMKRPGTQVLAYDLKHSRDIPRCTSHGTKDEGELGYVGDFLKEWGLPVRTALKEHNSLKDKAACFLTAVSTDLSVLDSDYPSTKLVDQSAMIFLVRLPEGAETARNTTMIEQKNNVFRVTKEGQNWLLVIGLIDLFAEKNFGMFTKAAGKWWQSHVVTSSSDYIFQMNKFSLYPFGLSCLMQYIFYFEYASEDTANATVTTTWDDGIGKRLRCSADDPRRRLDGKWEIHDALRNDWACSMAETCYAKLNTAATHQNIHRCCEMGNDLGKWPNPSSCVGLLPGKAPTDA